MKKTVLKVNNNCQKCKTDVLKAVSKLSGIDQIAVNGEKGTLTVIGEVDPVLVSNQVRKIGKMADIISVGPPKPDPPTPNPCSPNHLPTCNDCQLVAVSFAHYDAGRLCSIL